MKINAELVEKTLVLFLREEIHKFGFQKGILGLSGGLDSAVVAYLAAKALGPENLLLLLLPYQSSDRNNLEDARDVVLRLKTPSYEIDVTPQIDAYFSANPTDDRLAFGNKIARERMSILFDFSQREKAMVLGTSNKTELLLGYGTWYGDMASSLNPLGDLYKTQVFQLAEALGVSEAVRAKAPSADLWPGQTDEGEMGLTYAEADKILYLLVDRRMTPEEVVEEGYPSSLVQKICAMVKRNQFKRQLPVIAKLSHRTVEKDFLYPRDWGV